MKLSRTAQYAVRAVLYLGEHARSGPVTVGTLAEELSIPRNYLAKTLLSLSRWGVLSSARGPGGGFELDMPPEELSLFEVVQPFEDLEARRECVLGESECTEERPCPLHHRWKDVAEEIAAFFRDTTVAEVIRSRSEAPAPPGTS